MSAGQQASCPAGLINTDVTWSQSQWKPMWANYKKKKVVFGAKGQSLIQLFQQFFWGGHILWYPVYVITRSWRIITKISDLEPQGSQDSQPQAAYRLGTSVYGCKSACWHICTFCLYSNDIVKIESQIRWHPLLSQFSPGLDCIFRWSQLFTACLSAVLAVHCVFSGVADCPNSFQQELFCCMGSFWKRCNQFQPHELTTSTKWTLNAMTTTNFQRTQQYAGKDASQLTRQHTNTSINTAQ